MHNLNGTQVGSHGPRFGDVLRVSCHSSRLPHMTMASQSNARLMGMHMPPGVQQQRSAAPCTSAECACAASAQPPGDAQANSRHIAAATGPAAAGGGGGLRLHAVRACSRCTRAIQLTDQSHTHYLSLLSAAATGPAAAGGGRGLRLHAVPAAGRGGGGHRGPLPPCDGVHAGGDLRRRQPAR